MVIVVIEVFCDVLGWEDVSGISGVHMIWMQYV